MAALGKGHYLQVEQSGNAVAISTPYDKKMAKLSARLDDTRLYYGSRDEKAMQAKKEAATIKLHKKASKAALARRATFNASASGKSNLLGEAELVEAIDSGRVELSSITSEELPESLQALTHKEQKATISKMRKDRERLQQEIKKLAKQRNQYLKKEVSKRGGVKDSFDAKIFSTIRDQAKQKGLIYDKDSASY